MIAFVRGKVDYIGKNYCFIDTGTIGYRIFMAAGDLQGLSIGQSVKLYTHLGVREDALTLYGFATKEAYNLFMQLITVSGIGPKGALGILSGSKVDAFYLAIQSKDLKYLTKLPGIGKKTAERMLLELKGKIGTINGAQEGFADSTGTVNTDTPMGEAIAALVSLGYVNSEIVPILQKIEDKDKLSAEELIRSALKMMAGRK
ncbi:MAG: Holliday junction branch migration protein RuvA [Acidaminococcaceae bacterium]|jgi:Holliday junction DNA helicase RuvA|nr:Holliday junction branch migration protein RuvA [Acidaminococcaceae bacterium]